MLTLKALVILAASFTAPVSAGVVNSSLTNFASHSYLNGSLKLSSSQRKELDCLTKVIWFEARGESKRGKIMVANVVQNRESYGKLFANTVCDVVYQRNQFAWTRDLKKKQVRFKDVAHKHMKTEQKQVMDTLNIAFNIMLFNPPVITKATHFCSKGEKCNFGNVKKLGKEGNHTFFEYLGNS